jgi:hypothetical protein
MKKYLAIALAVVSLPLFALPASAGQHQPVGARISVILGTPTVFPAGAPFHIQHGWGQGAIAPPSQTGLWRFALDVDGVPRAPDYFFETTTAPPDTSFAYPVLGRFWVFNFPDGMTGTHTVTGFWIGPCAQAVQYNGYPGPCSTPNAEVIVETHAVTVTFVP